MANESKKQYVIKGKIVGTYESDTVEIDISLSDSELERIKDLIKSSDSKDLRWVIQDEFPELYEQINAQLQDAAYDYYAQEYKDYFAESEDDEEDPNDIELTGEEYSCPIPKEWYMKYKFQVMVALTYKDKDIEVEIPLSEKEVTKIKQLVAENNNTEEEAEVDEDTYMPTPSLLTILEENDKDLFKKFWKFIMPPVFVEFLIDAFTNGDIEEHEDDNFYDYHKADFDKLYEMYGDDIELEHSSCCICRIPEDWKKQ
jgi:predicted DNA binding CopG/RHH family protein